MSAFGLPPSPLPVRMSFMYGTYQEERADSTVREPHITKAHLSEMENDLPFCDELEDSGSSSNSKGPVITQQHSSTGEQECLLAFLLILVSASVVALWCYNKITDYREPLKGSFQFVRMWGEKIAFSCLQ